MWLSKNHETFKTASSHGNQSPFTERETLRISKNKKGINAKNRKQLLKVTSSSDLSSLRTLFLVAKLTAKGRKSLTTGEVDSAWY